jgi:ubiquinol-cytochrome c reductase cytochrome b subunit
VLFLGGSQDIIAGTLRLSIGNVTTILQITALVAPPIAYYLTYRICRALQTRPGPDRTERAGVIMRDAGGGYHEATEREEEAAETVDAASPVGAGE